VFLWARPPNVRSHYNKKGFLKKLFQTHLQGRKEKYAMGFGNLVDGSDIQRNMHRWWKAGTKSTTTETCAMKTQKKGDVQ
jgi:hypothetical protein